MKMVKEKGVWIFYITIASGSVITITGGTFNELKDIAMKLGVN